MTKNEIVAKWLGFDTPIGDWHLNDYNTLHQAWVKFRDLKLIGDPHRFQHTSTCWKIADRIAHGTITEAFEELVKGIKWVNSLKK